MPDTKTKNQYKKVGSAFFKKSDEGLQAVADPDTISKLKSGELSAEEMASTEADFASTIAKKDTGPMEPGDVDSEETEAKKSTDKIKDTTPSEELFEMEKERRERLREKREEREEKKKRRRELAEERAEIIEEAPSQRELLEEGREKYGVPSMLQQQKQSLQEVQDLRNRMTELEKERAEAMATSESREAPMGFIRGEQARLKERYDRREAILASRMQAENARVKALQGQVSQARSLIKDTVQAATFDTEMELKRINTFRDLNQDQIDELDRDIQNEIERSRQYWQSKLKRERKEKGSVMELMIEAPQAGITLDDDIETATEKYNEAASAGLLSDEDKDLFAPAGERELAGLKEFYPRLGEIPEEHQAAIVNNLSKQESRDFVNYWKEQEKEKGKKIDPMEIMSEWAEKQEKDNPPPYPAGWGGGQPGGQTPTDVDKGEGGFWEAAGKAKDWLLNKINL